MRVRRAVVVGAGTMGAAIAELLAFNEIDVVLKDVDAARVEAGLARVRGLVGELVAFHEGRGDREIARIEALGVKLDASQTAALRGHLVPKVGRDRGAAIVGRVRGATGPDDLQAADLAIEAVFETYAVKRAVLEELDRLVDPGAIIASNTSSLSITALAKGLPHRDRILVAHFFNPPSTLPLVEVSGGLETREDRISELVEFLQGLRNHRTPLLPIRVKESPAFVVNRLLLPLLNEASFALEEGVASARDIDAAMKAGAGLPMGPFELADLVGLDIALEVCETLHRETGDPKYRASPMLRRYVAAGFLGRKSGRGFYEYP